MISNIYAGIVARRSSQRWVLSAEKFKVHTAQRAGGWDAFTEQFFFFELIAIKGFSFVRY